MLSTGIDNFMHNQMNRLFHSVPGANHLADYETILNQQYYIRHRVETVKRIWMTSQTDALALAAMIDEDYESARIWSKYLTQELNHDLLFLKDLEKHKYSLKMVASISCFPATVAMVEYLKNTIARYGSIAAVAYSVWVEWNSDKASLAVVKNAQKNFSPIHVKGANAHTLIDIQEDHYVTMLKIVDKLYIRGSVDETTFFQILIHITDFFIEYFKQLEKETF